MKLNIKVMAEIAIFAALGWILDFFCDKITDLTPLRAIWFNGGSITIGFIPIAIIAYRRGWKAGVFTGILMMLLGFMNGFYAIASTWYRVLLQLALDYFIAWPLVGLCGLFRKLYRNSSKKLSNLWLGLGVFAGAVLKFFAHFLAGIIFWGDFRPEGQSAGYYSFWYNGTQVFISAAISIVILIIINISYHQFFIPEEEEE